MHTCSAPENDRKHIISNIRKNCCLVEEAISHLQMSKKNIEENASNIRAEIISDISVVLDNLRKREISLLRQIDAIESHQLNKLQATFAELHHLLGKLRRMHHCVENQLECHSCSQYECDVDIVEAIKKQKTTYSPICYWADKPEMEAVIRNFGLVRMNPLLCPEDSNVTSRSLQSKMEEYGEDHHLLYKTLQEIEEPKANNLEGWLRCDAPVSSFTSSGSFYLPAYFQSQDISYWLRKESSEINERTEKWLLDMRINDCFREVVSNKNDDKETLKDDQRSEGFTSSIDVISFPDILDTTTNSISSVEISSGCSSKNVVPVSNTVDRKSNKLYCCNNANTGSVDIENLDTITCTNGDFICREIDRWLFKGTTDMSLEQSLAKKLHIADICCANEPCKCFNECVCKEKCSQKAFEKQGYLNCNFEVDKNMFLRKTTKQPNHEQDNWLRKSAKVLGTECEENWLKIDTNMNNEKMDVSEKIDIRDPMLSQDITKQQNSENLNMSWNYSDNKLWMKSSQPKLISESLSYIRDDFKSYFLSNDINTWLSN